MGRQGLSGRRGGQCVEVERVRVRDVAVVVSTAVERLHHATKNV